jgi:hypothetical protein
MDQNRRDFLNQLLATVIFAPFVAVNLSKGKNEAFKATFITPVNSSSDVYEFHANELSKWQNHDGLYQVVADYAAQGRIIDESLDFTTSESKWSLTFKSESDYWAWEKDLENMQIFDMSNGAERVQRVMRTLA